MRAHQTTGPIRYTTLDLVLGASDTLHHARTLLEQHQPDTIALDLTHHDLTNPQHPTNDPILNAHAHIAPPTDHPTFAPYHTLLDYAHEHDLPIHPLNPPTIANPLTKRRIKKTAQNARTHQDPQQHHRTAANALLNDETTIPHAQKRRRQLATNLTNLLDQEPPRTLAAFTYPWGQMVSAQLRRELDLQRTPLGQAPGGWPE